MAERYECDGCGECCRRKLVDVFEEDVLREPRRWQADVASSRTGAGWRNRVSELWKRRQLLLPRR